MPTFEMPKTYDPAVSERRIYEWWEQSGFFKPEIAGPDAKPFVISIPPPNITGELHLGHAMFVSLEDLMIRYKRMRGYAALWVPGYDHAGIATQLQVEKMLAKEGVRRQDIGREEFLRRTWAWKEKYGGHIVRQLRRLGGSCDWDRMRFTLDEGLSRAVREAFVRLYRMGLIYRGEYLINWSPGLQTAVSDLEVEYREENATLYYFKYPIAGANLDDGPGVGYIPVATTRPETILGDSAVAVHPDDERYRHLIGATCLVPMLKRTIPIIHDTYVDMAFGTGALKITPGHDPNDFEIGQRHGLPIISVLDRDAKVSAEGGPYAGLDRFECRKKLWADMEAAGLTIKAEPYVTQVPRSQRGGEIVEPMVSTQWFVKIKPMADMGLEAVRSGRITIIPDRFTKVYYNWLENIRDWCISRQLWWGHRIPAWHCADCKGMTVAKEDPTGCAHCGSARIEQDPDVLDTWFSSGLWPFSTLGWPDDTPDLRRYYPTTVMETGYDIIFFWVARMVMQGLLYTNDIPFETIYLHGLVRDDQGRKMSKTTGNVLDPIALLDGAKPEDLSDYIRAQYPDGLQPMGADALRFTLLTGSTPGSDMNLSLQRVEGNRNFTNKIWNAVRFVLSQMTDEGPMTKDESLATGDISSFVVRPSSLAERWILSRLAATIADATRLMDTFQYGEVGRQIYDFFWSEFCDWYLEISKIALYRGDATAKAETRATLVKVLDESLRLLHPFIPFVTEETWGYLKAAEEQGSGGAGWPEALIVAPWPQAGARDLAAEADMGLVMDLVRAIRNARAEYDVKPGAQLAASIAAGSRATLLNSQAEVLCSLARLDPTRLMIAAQLEAPAKALTLVVGSVTAYLPLADLVDLAAERAKLNKELVEAEAQIDRSRSLLDGPFAQRAPANVVQREREKLGELATRAKRLRERLAELG